jgi:hypothetical protein
LNGKRCSGQTEKARQVKGKVKNKLNFFDIKNSSWQETVNAAYYCDVLRQLRENVRRLRPKLLRQKNWLLHHENAPSHISFSTREFLLKTE